MAKWAKLTYDQSATMGFSPREDEIILIDYSRNPVEADSFYFNADEFFTEEALEDMPWFGLHLFSEVQNES